MKPMLLLSLDKNRKAFTLLEMIIAFSIICFVGTIVVRWFIMNRQYQKRVTELYDGDTIIRNAIWEIHKDLKTSRTVIYPRALRAFANDEFNMSSDSKLVVKNFEGDIVSYFYKRDTKELVRVISHVPTDDAPQDKTRVIAKNLNSVVFTNKNLLNNCVNIYMECGPSVLMDAVFLMND